MDFRLLDRAERRNIEPLPPSNLLIERLERRRRARHTDVGPSTRLAADDDIFLHQAADEPPTDRALLSASVGGISGARSLAARPTPERRSDKGVRGIDERMDRFAKDNFALKLELDQRRRHVAKLREQNDSLLARLERFERLQEEHAELWRINDTLVLELEKRDRAVEEAIDVICELEDKVADFEEHRTSAVTRPSTAAADSGYAGTDTSRPSPPNRLKPFHTSDPREPTLLHTRPLPSALGPNKASFQALRRAYLDSSHDVKSSLSQLKERESVADDAGGEALHSPRLSVLSESSFPSIYHPSPDRFTWEADYGYGHDDSLTRVDRWIHEGQAVHSSSPPRETEARPEENADFRSVADTCVKARHRLPKGIIPPPYNKSPAWPPTPDTVSTHVLDRSHDNGADDAIQLDYTPIDLGVSGDTDPSIRTAPKQLRSSADLSTAYHNYLQRRHTETTTTKVEAFSARVNGIDHRPSSSFTAGPAPTSKSGRADSGRIHDLGIDYDGFPDGNSISNGTPSRFTKHVATPAKQCSNDAILTMRCATHEGLTSSPELPPLRRFQSSGTPSTAIPGKGEYASASAVSGEYRPALTRAETSPSTFGSSAVAKLLRRMSNSNARRRPR